MKEPLIDICQASMINSSACKILDLDLVKMNPAEVEFANEYSIEFTRNDKVHALIAWFDTPFSDL